LSGGNQRRWFSDADLVSPAILLLDDPTKGVDVSSRRELHNSFVKPLIGMTVLIVSSDNDD
jgi:ABC-type sugar transport system ATPase subunit